MDAEPSRTTIVDAHNGFNGLSHLAMMWTVRHCWPAGARFAFNCYRHWAQLLPPHNSELIGGNSGRPPFYGTIQYHPRPPCRGAKSGVFRLLSPFYAIDAAFDDSAQRSAQLLKLLMKRGRTGNIFLRLLSPSLSRTHRCRRQR